MTTIKGGTRKYFLCTGKTHKKTCSGILQTVYAEDMEAMASDCIAQKLASLKLSRTQRTEENAQQINSLKLKLKEVEQKLSALSEAVLGGALNDEMIALLNDKAKALTAKKRSLLEKIDELLASDGNARESVNFARRWATADFKEKRAVCNVLIKAIIMYEDGSAEIIWNI